MVVGGCLSKSRVFMEPVGPKTLYSVKLLCRGPNILLLYKTFVTIRSLLFLCLPLQRTKLWSPCAQLPGGVLLGYISQYPSMALPQYWQPRRFCLCNLSVGLDPYTHYPICDLGTAFWPWFKTNCQAVLQKGPLSEPIQPHFVLLPCTSSHPHCHLPSCFLTYYFMYLIST